MFVLRLNATSSSLKCVLMESEERRVVARASAEWAGPTTRYQRVGPGVERGPETVPWKGHAEAVRHAVADLGPPARRVAKGATLAAVGHRIGFDEVLGGGSAKELKKLPPAGRLGSKTNAFAGGFQFWGGASA